MNYKDLNAFMGTARDVLSAGPIAIVIAEDEVELTSTLEHHLNQGFRSVVLLHPPHVGPPSVSNDRVHSIPTPTHREDVLTGPINRLVAAAKPGTWMFYCYNAEYLMYPFCETRSVGEMLAFHGEERRNAMLTFVVDLYADSLDLGTNAVSLERAHMDKAGYFALTREGSNGAKDRQFDFYGGLRWRFEEHVPEKKRRIDRVSLFRAGPDLHLRDDHTFDNEDYNTFSCPWHHNLTAAVASFRTAKALKLNPGSSHDISTFQWFNSTKFEWTSHQLMDLGLMEPGQWF